MLNGLNLPINLPPKLESNTLRFVPLGGLKEVGRNCLAVEFIDPIRDGGFGEPRILLIDCGVLFPGDDEPGVDLILPDFTYIADRLDRVEAVIITHGHEDHIGGIPYLLKLKPDLKIVGTEFSLELIKRKLSYHKAEMNQVKVVDRQVVQFGPFQVQFLPVTHSIPDASAIFVKTAAGNFIHTGDFKMDQLPLDNRLTELKDFTKASEEGVDLFMVDSTNAEYPGFVMPEVKIGTELEKIFASIRTGKIFVTSFASHIHRIQNIMNAALRTNRKVVLAGKSLEHNVGVAVNLDKLTNQEVLVNLNDIGDYLDEQLIVVATGSQGESQAALARMADESYPKVSITSQDTVVFASSSVPGNEKVITALINKIVRLGARVITAKDAPIHCSGHACQGELEYIYNVVKPKNVLPVHGEVKHLLANAEVAKRCGVNNESVAVLVDGGVLDLKDGNVWISGQIECGEIYVDGKSVGEEQINEYDLVARRVLSEEGFIAVTAVVDLDSKRVITRPKVVAKGVAEDESVYYKLPEKITAALKAAMNDDNVDDLSKLTRVVRRTTGKWVAKTLRRSPMILPIVTNYQETSV